MVDKTINRSIHVATPLLHTWWCQDFVGENGVSDYDRCKIGFVEVVRI